MPGLELPGKLGFLNIREERGGVIIRAPLVMRSKGYVFPSLSLLAVCQYLGVEVRFHLGEARAVGAPGKPDARGNSSSPLIGKG